MIQVQQLKNQKISLWLFVGNIPKIWKKENLIQFFSQYGQIQEVKIVKSSHCSRISYVNFKSMTCAYTAIEALKKQNVHNLTVMWLDTQSSRLGIGQNDDHKLFIGSLPRQATSQDLYELFSIFGEVQAIRLDQKYFWAFVDYKNKESALLAIKYFDKQVMFHGSHIPIDVRFKEKKYNSFMQKKNEKQPLDPFEIADDSLYIEICHQDKIYFYHVKSQTISNVKPKPKSKVQIWNSPNYYYIQQQFSAINDFNRQNKRLGPPGANLFLFHLPSNIRQSQIFRIFSKFGNVISVRIITQRNGKSKGIGFVSYDSPFSAKLAIEEMNGIELKGKKLKVQLNKKDLQNLEKDSTRLDSFQSF